MPPNSLSYIHTRTLLGSFTDFRDIVRKAFRYVEPGGWFESQEIYPSVYCDDGTMPADWPMLHWAKMQDDAAMNMGRPLRIANKLKRWYQEQGFINVKEEVFKVPMNPWPKDPQFKLIGRFHERNMLDGLQGFSLAFFHRGLGWTKEEIEVYLVDVRKALQDKRVHAYQKVYVFHQPELDFVRLMPRAARLESIGQTESRAPLSSRECLYSFLNAADIASRRYVVWGQKPDNVVS